MDYHKIVVIFVQHYHKYVCRVTMVTIHPNYHLLFVNLGCYDTDHGNSATIKDKYILISILLSIRLKSLRHHNASFFCAHFVSLSRKIRVCAQTTTKKKVIYYLLYSNMYKETQNNFVQLTINQVKKL